MCDRPTAGLLLATMLSILVPLGQGQILINGGFENGAIDPGSWSLLSKDSTQINGWIVGGEGVDYIGGLWQPSEGSRSIDLSAYGAGTISTTLNTVPGTTYRLFFDMAGNPGGDPVEKALKVWIDDISQDFSFDTTGKTAENMEWQTKSLDFTAASSATRLTFESLVDAANGPALDNVRVTAGDDQSITGANANVDLTGVWSCNDGATYYLRQIGNVLWWDGDGSSETFSNVAHGSIDGNTITLEYADVPEGRAIGYGKLVLNIISNDELEAKEKPENYRGSHWVRSSNKPQTPANPPVNPSSSPANAANPWEDPSVRQLIDEWILQQDNCAKKVYPGAFIDKWGRLCGETDTTTISCVLDPDHPLDWDSYHYLWYNNPCSNYYPYRLQDYVNLRQGGSSFDDLAGCKGWSEGCY
jgi:choice-of-anchor C domain-containing protein